METTKTNWVIDASHSKVGFKVKHLMISNVLGSFKEFEGTAETVGDDFFDRQHIILAECSVCRYRNAR